MMESIKDWTIKRKLFTVIASVFIIAFLIGTYLQYQATKNEVFDQVLSEARSISGIIMASRRVYQHQFINSGLPLNENTIGFLPAHSLNKISNDFKNWVNSGLSFNNVSDRPSNLDNLADEIEMQSIQFFREHRDKKEHMVPFKNAEGESFFHYSQPIWIKKYCLECHGPRDQAPASIQKLYDTAYDYKLGDLRGILSIKLPVDMAYQTAIQRHLTEFIYAVILFILIYLILQVLIKKLITERMEKLSQVARQIAQGNTGIGFNEGSKDEIGQIESSINTMLQKIRQREQDLDVTLNSIGDAVIATDKAGNITRMNPVAEQLTGWLLEQAQGKSVRSIFPIIDASTRLQIENPIEKVMGTGETVYLSNHTTLISRNGNEYQIADSAAPIRNSENEILGMVLVFNDVTEQYQLRQSVALSKKKYKTLAEVAPVGFFYTNKQGKCLYVNEKWSEITGITAEQAKDNGWINALHPDDFKLVTTIWNNTIKNQKSFKLEFRFRQGESTRWVLGQAVAETGSHGEVISYVGTITDITERKLSEQENVKLQYHLHQSQKMDALGKLTGGIAHDYNNMLGVVSGYSDLLEEALDDQPTLAKYAHEINHAAQRGARLTKKLLAFTLKRSSGAKCINLNSLLLTEQHMLEKVLTARINLQLKLTEHPWKVWLDDSDMVDAILNLSINAMHAIEGSGHFTIQTENQKISYIDAKLLGLRSGDYVLLSLTDTGCGMDTKTKEKIFEPFFSTKGSKGTGLGLSQVYGFVERSGGAINVHSEIDHGTRITLYLPSYRDSNTQLASIKEQQNIDIHGSETILVVDDEAALLSLYDDILSPLGFQVLKANSAKNALQLLDSENINILISDIIMPEMDGFQLSTIVKDKYPHIKIQLASGFSDAASEYIVDEQLQKNILLKPFNSNELLQKIQAFQHDLNLPQNTKLPLFEWSENLNTNITAIDEDHKVLVLLLNNCINYLNSPEKDLSQIDTILNDLLDYTQYHFTKEEYMMQTYGYSGLEKHKKVHQLLIDEVNRRFKEHKLGILTMHSLFDFLKHWLSSHILGMDKSFSLTCTKNGNIINGSVIKSNVNTPGKKTVVKPDAD